MTFPYSPAIPNPPNDPADDVSIMQTNAGSISSILAVDHVGFNLSGGGEHKQVTFNSNNPPAPPVSPAVLFTNNQDGAGNNLPGSLAELFFYSGSASQSANQYNITATNGSVLLMMGVILKWGSYTLGPGVPSTTITFTNAFPNNIFSIVTGSNVSGSPNDLPRIISNSTAGFVGGRVNASSPLGGTFTYYYVAIGN